MKAAFNNVLNDSIDGSKLQKSVEITNKIATAGDVPSGGVTPKSLGISPKPNTLATTEKNSGLNVAKGISEMYVKRTTTVLEQFYGVTVNSGGDIISTIISLIEKATELWNSLFGAKSKVDKKVKSSSDGYKERVQEVAKAIIPTLEAVGVLTDGLHVTKSEQHILSNNQLLIDSQLVTSINSGAYIELATTALTMSTRHTTAACDVWQGIHYFFNVQAKAHIQFESNTAMRVCTGALKETSAEAEYVASTLTTYGDLVWNQAGQVSNIPISSNIPKETKVNYGCMVNIAQRHQAFLASTGFIAMQAKTIIAIDSTQLALNCGWAQVSNAVIPKIFAPIMSNTTAISEQEATEPNNPVIVDDAIKVGAYPEGFGLQPKKK